MSSTNTKSRPAMPPFSTGSAWRVEGLPNEGRGDVAPNRVRRAAPLPGAEDLARSVDILKTRPDKRQLVAAEIIIAVHLANQLRDRVRAVMEQ